MRFLLDKPNQLPFKYRNIINTGAVNVLFAERLIFMGGNIPHTRYGPPRNLLMSIFQFRREVLYQFADVDSVIQTARAVRSSRRKSSGETPLSKSPATAISERIFSTIWRSRSFTAPAPPFPAGSCCWREAGRGSRPQEDQEHLPNHI